MLDRETGLVWQRSPDTEAVNWTEALGFCSSRVTGNRFGWRLPAAAELYSLGDRISGLPTGHPFLNVVVNGEYWTTTQDIGPVFGGFVLTMIFFTSGAQTNEVFPGIQVGQTTAFRHWWCVRGGRSNDYFNR